MGKPQSQPKGNEVKDKSEEFAASEAGGGIGANQE